jgi:hypothetical protein
LRSSVEKDVVIRLALAAVLLASCLPGLQSTGYPGVVNADGCTHRDGIGRCIQECSRKYDTEADKVAADTLAETRRLGLLIKQPVTAKAILYGVRIGHLWTPTLLSKTPVTAARPRAPVTPSPADVLPAVPLALCIVDKPAPIDCGIPVYGCAIPMRDRNAIYVAGQHAQWKQTLVHEILCVLAYVGQMRGWPHEEADVIKRQDYRDIISAVAP